MAPAEAWPLDYVAEFARRQRVLLAIRADPNKLLGAKEFYRTRPVEFITHWCTTYDPRNAGSKVPAIMPFLLFKRQRELVEFVLACLRGETSGLIEKCRDMGATWVCAALSVWLWLYWPGAAIGWGSREQDLVDNLGDPDSILEKMRMTILGLPSEFLPAGFDPKRHLSFMRLVNPETGATITGDIGDNIGRGGRKLIYFKDESAHYVHPEKIEAALGDNTRCQIDISSVNGLGNVFHRRRESGIEWTPDQPAVHGKTNVFVMDWRDHPAKSQAWFDARRQKAVDDGLLHVFAQEVGRNYAAAVEGVIIPAEWVRSAIDAHLKLGFADDGGWGAALDVADGGGDRNALVTRKGVILKTAQEWSERDTGVTARNTVAAARDLVSQSRIAVEVQYDCVGVGSGIKAEINRLGDENGLPTGVRFIPWDAGAGVLDPERRVIPDDRDSPLNKDFYANLKAQAWWQLRLRFERTHHAITEGVKFPPDQLISLPSELPLLRQIEKELSQSVRKFSGDLRLLVDKTPAGTRSPNLADAIVMAYWPVKAPQTRTQEFRA